MTDRAALEPGAHLLPVNGVAQSYHVAGSGPVCVVHPGGPGANWSYMRMPSLEASMTMIYLEPIGTGASGRLPQHPAGYTVGRFSEQLRDFLEVLDLRDVFLLGQSHGGFVVQDYALAHPERLAGLILCNTSAVTGPEFMQAADTAVRQAVAGYSDRSLASSVLAAWEAVPKISGDASYTDTMRGLFPAYFSDPSYPDIPVLQAQLNFSFVVGDDTPFDVRSGLSSLRVPTLIVVGGKDFICGPQWADTLEVIPGAERAEFAQSGHLVHVEEPEAFASAVGGFMRRHTTAGGDKRNEPFASETTAS
jgi:pimeloyl-ACP methyl ester carboxylesterase